MCQVVQNSPKGFLWILSLHLLLFLGFENIQIQLQWTYWLWGTCIALCFFHLLSLQSEAKRTSLVVGNRIRQMRWQNIIRNQTPCYCWTLYFAIPQNGGHRLFILVSASNDLSSSDPSGSPGSDETDLLTSAGSPPDGGGLADVLMVTSSVGMLHGVHSNTTNLNDKRWVTITTRTHQFLLMTGLMYEGWNTLLSIEGEKSLKTYFFLRLYLPKWH